jgi:hypothetical protein
VATTLAGLVAGAAVGTESAPAMILIGAAMALDQTHNNIVSVTDGRHLLPAIMDIN